MENPGNACDNGVILPNGVYEQRQWSESGYKDCIDSTVYIKENIAWREWLANENRFSVPCEKAL